MTRLNRLDSVGEMKNEACSDQKWDLPEAFLKNLKTAISTIRRAVDIGRFEMHVRTI